MKLRSNRRFRRFLIATATVLVLCVLCALILPPMFTLNHLRGKIEAGFSEQTGATAQIVGDIHFSMGLQTTIVAHDVIIPNGHIDTVRFAVPATAMFDIRNARLKRKIAISGMRMEIETLAPVARNYNLDLRDCVIRFLDKDYEIVSGRMRDGEFNGTVRTDQHKYEVTYSGNEFVVINHTNNLTITGTLLSSGGARGKMQMETPNVNRWFQFRSPRILGVVRISSEFEWDGAWGVKFRNISANNFVGNIDLMPNGDKNIQLRAHNVDYDFSFLLNPNRMVYRTTFDLDFYGNLKLADYEFAHLKMNAVGTQSRIQIAGIIADDITITGGTIDADGAHNIRISAPMDGQTVSCVFSGTSDVWHCDEFAYGDIQGDISVNNGVYLMHLKSDGAMPEYDAFMTTVARLGRRGTIYFDFSDVAGTFNIDGENVRATYKYARGKTLRWGRGDITLLPARMMDAVGDFTWTGEMIEFVPHAGGWKLNLYDNYFYLYGDKIKDLMPDVNLDTINDAAYAISGRYDGANVSELTIKLLGHEFRGTANGNNLTLDVDTLDLDAFVSSDFTNNYHEREFTTNAPLIQVFGIPVNISLTAKAVVYNGDAFRNFVYSLKPNIQTFSVSDDDRGNLLATITRNKNNYNIFAQLNRFVTHGRILGADMPMNVRDSRVTAEFNLQTSGQIAHDIFYNMTGDMDISFDGGYFIGLGVDGFYARAADITTMNAEYALADAISGGESEIKTLRIVGTYTGGAFHNTSPIELELRHTDARGNINIADGKMYGDFRMILRGTSPDAKPLDFTVNSDGSRKYSLTQIMDDFDASFLREFVRTHDRF